MAQPFTFPSPVKIRLPSAGNEGPKVQVALANAKLVLTNDIVAQANRYVQSGATAGKIVEWRDVKQTGLVLRLQAKSAVWLLRRRTNTYTVGRTTDFSIFYARWLVGHALAMAEAGGDPREYIDRVRKVLIDTDGEAAMALNEKLWLDENNRLIGPEVPIDDEQWTWSFLRQKFLEEKMPDLGRAWGPQFRKILEHQAFGSIERLPVSKVGLKELNSVKRNLSRQLPKSQATRAMNQTKAMLNWAYSEHPAEVGFDEYTPPWWLRLNIKYEQKQRLRTPEITELVRTLLLAEHLHANPGKSGRSIGAGTIGALWAVILTGQRIGPLLKTTTKHIYSHDGLPEGWKVLNWTAKEMKPARGEALPHSLPIPPQAHDILSRFRVEAGGGRAGWLFPSATGSTCVSNAGLEALLRRLDGIRYKTTRHPKGEGPGRGRAKPRTPDSTRQAGRSLLKELGIEYWTPHDVRRSLQSFLDDKELGGIGSAILAHREGRSKNKKENEEERTQTTTMIHYSRGQKVVLKSKGMKLWTDAIFEAYAAEKAKF